ncbi:MAG: hypothetical protein AAGI07_08760, partial [Bacteroidota bacterium]
MKLITNHITILLIYSTGINLYFCLWYLGSEGQASIWEYEHITYYHIWLQANFSTVLSFYLLNKLRRLTKDWTALKIYFLKTEFMFQCVTNTLFFTGMLIFCLSVFSESVALSNSLAFLNTTNFLSLSIYHFTLSIVIVALLNLKQRFGVFHKVTNYLSWRKLSPRAVERGFIFLDLNNSTGIAERLKSGAYSAFLRDCFETLDEIIEKAKGFEVYQYVGD